MIQKWHKCWVIFFNMVEEIIFEIWLLNLVKSSTYKQNGSFSQFCPEKMEILPRMESSIHTFQQCWHRIFPWVFPEFLKKIKIPWVFQVFPEDDGFSRFSRFSRLCGFPWGWWVLQVLQVESGPSICLLSDYRYVGQSICYCRTTDMSGHRHVIVGLSICRTIEICWTNEMSDININMSDNRHVGVTNRFCRTSEISDHRYVEMTLWFVVIFT